MRVNDEVIEAALAVVEAARSWSPRLVSRLETLVRDGADRDLVRVSPLRFARERRTDPEEAIDLFLHAAHAGVFEFVWFLVCPLCADVVESLRSLRSVQGRFHCTLCHGDFEALLDDHIGVGFTVSPRVRPIAHHTPDELSALDYVFEYRGCMDGLGPDGSPWPLVIRSLSPAISWLPPGEVTVLRFDAPPGILLGYDMDSDFGFVAPVAGEGCTADQLVRLRYTGEDVSAEVPALRPGPIQLEVENPHPRRGLVGCAVLPGLALERPPITFPDLLTGNRLLTNATFRHLFRTELIRDDGGLGIRDVTVVFTDLRGSTALYERIGDLQAFALVRQHFDELARVTARHGGTVIKTIGDAVMAAFLSPARGVRAALEMRDAVARGGSGELVLKVGVHRGPAIAVTLNERLDYFGRTINVAARAQAIAEAGEVVLTEEVATAAGVSEALDGLAPEQLVARLRGVEQPHRLVRVRG